MPTMASSKFIIINTYPQFLIISEKSCDDEKHFLDLAEFKPEFSYMKAPFYMVYFGDNDLYQTLIFLNFLLNNQGFNKLYKVGNFSGTKEKLTWERGK